MGYNNRYGGNDCCPGPHHDRHHKRHHDPYNSWDKYDRRGPNNYGPYPGPDRFRDREYDRYNSSPSIYIGFPRIF